MQLSIAIQHHPRRAALLPALLATLPVVDVVTDPDPEGRPCPLRTYAEALRYTPAEATYRLVLQDDVTLCERFLARAREAVEAHPDGLLCLFVPGIANGGGNYVRRAHAAGDPYVQLRANGRIVPAVATVWPAELGREFVSYVDAERERTGRLECSDDGMMGKFARRAKVEVWATVPSLVQHPDVVPSLIGRVARAGRDRGRVAAVFG